MKSPTLVPVNEELIMIMGFMKMIDSLDLNVRFPVLWRFNCSQSFIKGIR